MFTIEVLPAQRGDCLWLTYGEGDDLHHVLVDAGPQDTIPTLVPMLEERLTRLGKGVNRVELLVVTHVDADHIQGVASLLSVPKRVTLFRDVWFNGWPQLGLLGARDGEMVTRSLNEHPTRWNRSFKGGPVVVRDDEDLPTRRLAGGLELTVIAPDVGRLEKLAPEWEATCRKAGIVPGHGAEVRKSYRREGFLGFDVDQLAAARFTDDRTAPNGSSIALVASYGGKRVLLTGDAPAQAIAAGLDRLGPGPHRFAAVKVSHHGSKNNTSLDLCGRIRSKNWLISSNGAQFGHPDPECLARIVTTQQRPVFHLNYVTEHTSDLISGAGDRYSVRLPRRRSDGTHAEGITFRIQ
jgi:beta-lactamase superfamily II metal-dependent hydrolase